MTPIKLIPTVAFFCLFFTTTVNSYGQKLKVDGYTIAIQKNAEHKQTNMHGKIYVSYKGFVKLNSKDSLKGIFSYNKKDGSEGKATREMFLPVEQVVLQGMLLWVKIKNEVPLE